MPPPITTTEAWAGSATDMEDLSVQTFRQLKHVFHYLTAIKTYGPLIGMNKSATMLSVESLIAENPISPESPSVYDSDQKQ